MKFQTPEDGSPQIGEIRYIFNRLGTISDQIEAMPANSQCRQSHFVIAAKTFIPMPAYPT